METKKHIIEYCEYESIQALPPSEKALMHAAMEATQSAYAPYSHFHVGAAVQLADGTLVTGSNQENIAYPSGLCAERTALFTASVQHPHQPVTVLAVVGRNPEGLFVEASPCGACRQVMAEIEQRQGVAMTILCYLAKGRIRRLTGVSSLLPFAFEAEL